MNETPAVPVAPGDEEIAEAMRDLRRMASVKTVDNFLSCDDETKRLIFANYLEESHLRSKYQRILESLAQSVLEFINDPRRPDAVQSSWFTVIEEVKCAVSALAATRPLLARQSTRRTDDDIEREIERRDSEEVRTKNYNAFDRAEAIAENTAWIDALRWTLNKTEPGR